MTGAVQHSRDALAELRWHPALRRRSAEVRAEVAVRAAASIATVLGARVPLEVVRAAGGGAGPVAGQDPSLAVALGALRATVVVDAVSSATPAPLQVLAKLHAAAAAGLSRGDPLGRPRPGSAGDVAAMAAVVSGHPGEEHAVGLRAAIAHAELVTTDAFAPVSTEVAFAFARGIGRWGGLDPMGVGLPEAHAVTDSDGYRRSLAGYVADPVPWCLWWLAALSAGAGHGRLVADAVTRGRFD